MVSQSIGSMVVTVAPRPHLVPESGARKTDIGHCAVGPQRCDTGIVDHLTRLLVAARDGDRVALERFVAETQADVWRLCRYLGDVRDADDLAQETYERAIGSIHRFRADGSARGWLLTIARRTCVDHTRRAVRRRRLDRAVLADTTAGSVDGSLIAPDMSGRVDLDDVLAHLDPDRRSAFVLTQVLGLQYDEAAEVLECPIGTIRSRVARARVDLVALMAAPDADAGEAVGR
jgi:RNA polymerase sigma-70 factor (ECF subfamily)